jgi:hypothetical protein
MGPALWSAYLSRDPALVKRIAAWADAWIVVMRDTRHGKPAGVFPSVMRASDGEYLIGANGWDKPEAEWDYFQWGGTSQEALTSLLLAVYDLTGERKYLDAAGETFRVMENCAAHEAICRAIRSSPEAFYTWRRLTGDARYDQAFGNHASPPDADIFGAMARTAREAEARFSVNWDIFTTEVLYTDRVAYPLASEYRWRLFGGEAPRGDRYPTFAVTWPAVKGDIARAVLDAGDTALRVQLYNFEASHLDAQLRLWRLKPGRYQWTDGERRGEFTVARLPHLLSVPLPPGKEVALSIQRAE